MKAVMLEVDPSILAERRRTGIDRLDEMWEGVLHIAPAPRNDHQDIATGIAAFLRSAWAPSAVGTVLVQANVSTPQRWDKDYRIPDVAVVRVAAPTSPYSQPFVVFEVRSPGDESYEKLPFYAAIGVEAVVIVDRDTRAVEVFELAGGEYAATAPAADGWTLVKALGVEMRADTAIGSPRQHLRLTGDAKTVQAI